MQTTTYPQVLPRALAALALTLSLSHAALAYTLRVGTYNLNSDTSSFTGDQQSALETVLEGINSYHLNDNGTAAARNLDILAVQELQNGLGSANADTLSSIVTNLNAKYGANTYAYDNTTDPTTGISTGNGPNGLVYNAQTLQVLSAAPLGTPSGSAEARAPMEYQLHPLGFSSAANFYVIVSHMKSGTTSSDITRRNAEATVIINAITALPANTHVLVLGDLNITDGSAESTYQTLLTKLDDVAHPTGAWADSNTTLAKQIAPLLSESATNVSYRDDMHLLTPAADPASPSAQSGFQYITGSSLVFGNGGSTSLVGNAVTSSVNSAALTDLPSAQRSAVLSALTTATDHLPVIADYALANLTPVPQAIAWIANRTGAWSTASNWSPATIPQNINTLSYAVTISSGNATLSTNTTINSLTMTGGTLAGSSNLTLTGGTISGAYNLTGTTTLAPDPITLTPAGTLTLNGTSHNAGQFTGTGNLTINSTATLTSDGITLNALTINGKSIIRTNGTLTGTSKLNALSFAGSTNNWTASLDLTNNKLILENTTSHAAALATLQNQLTAGLSHSAGIFSSTLPANEALALLDNAITRFTTFGNQQVDAGSILIAPELLGDTNADGTIDATDLQTVLANFGQTTPLWTSGNFANTPTINLTDLADVLNNFGATYASPTSQTPAPTPEPAPLSLLALAVLLPLTRRPFRLA